MFEMLIILGSILLSWEACGEDVGELDGNGSATVFVRLFDIGEDEDGHVDGGSTTVFNLVRLDGLGRGGDGYDGDGSSIIFFNWVWLGVIGGYECNGNGLVTVCNWYWLDDKDGVEHDDDVLSEIVFNSVWLNDSYGEGDGYHEDWSKILLK